MMKKIIFSTLFLFIVISNVMAINQKEVVQIKSVSIKDSSILTIIDKFIDFCHNECEQNYMDYNHISLSFFKATDDSTSIYICISLGEELYYKNYYSYSFRYLDFLFLIHKTSTIEVKNFIENIFDTYNKITPIEVEVINSKNEILPEGGGDAFWIVLYKNEKYYLVEKGCFQE